jgi:hypothetical protein
MLTVIVKATYKLVSGVTSLTEAQDGVNERDLHAENNPKLGLYSASDLVPYKPRADVTVVGKAYAPPNELSSKLVARVAVGTVDKRVEVHAERYFGSKGELTAEAFFSKIPIGYERAPAGPTNPVGRSLTARPDSRGRLRLPNLQVPGERVDAKKPLTPIGFGPIPPSWPSRLALLHDKAPAWQGRDWCSLPIPKHWNWAFFNVAPQDQQLDEISADEEIRLDHLHPKEPKLVTRLPGIWPCVFLERHERAEAVTMHGDTLWIDTNRLVQTVTWRGQAAMEKADESLRVLVAMANAQQTPRWDDVWAAAEVADRSAGGDIEDDAPTRIDPRSSGVVAGKARMTTRVPLSTGDHTPNWMPPPSKPGVAVSAAAQKAEPNAKPPISVPGGSLLQLPLDAAESRMLQELASASGKSAVEVLRQVLREAHAARFR